MLSKVDTATVQAFVSTLLSLKSATEITDFKRNLLSLQKFFQTQIQPIESENYQVRSLLVEINKQMRLLGMDLLFLQTAKQPETVQQRISQLHDRLDLLTKYCEGILAIDADSE